MNSSPRFQKAHIAQAVSLWASIEKAKEPADRWLGHYFYRNRKMFGSSDRRFLSEIIYGLFRHKTWIEAWAGALAVADPAFRISLAALIEGTIPQERAREILTPFLPRDFPLEPLLRPLGGFPLPAGCAVSDREEELSVRYSFPLWLIRRWALRLGRDRIEPLLAIFQTRPPLVVRANELKTGREPLMRIFRTKGHSVREAACSRSGIYFSERKNLFDSPEFRQGLFEIQDEGSQLAVEAMAAQPGEFIWDVCSGGGGKSLALAAVMKNKGRIVATDIRPSVRKELKKRAARAGIFNIFPAELARVGAIARVKLRGFDKILVDAPCSGTGTLRRNPDAKWKLSEERFARHHADQAGIIESALPWLRPGGVLFYVTCSLDPQENEEVMAAIFDRHKDLRPFAATAAPVPPWQPVPGGGFRLWPEVSGHDGFFLAAAEKI